MVTDAETALIERTRRIMRKLTGYLVLRGLEQADATVALAYALHDMASELTGSPFAGVEWMRDAADVMERKLMEGSHAKTPH